GAEVAVARDVLVAMTTQALAYDGNVLGFTLGMQFVANIAAAPVAAVLIDNMECAREGPLVGIDLGAADVAYLRLRQLHLLFGTGRVLLLSKVLLAQAS